MHQIHNNENDYAWQKKGKKGIKQVSANTGRKRLNIFGALNPLSYEVTSIITEANCDIESMKVFFSEIRKEYGENPITVFLDNARYQRAYEAQNHAKSLHITLEFLPPYSPNMDLIEGLWKFTKKKCFKNRYYEDFQTFEKTLKDFLGNLGVYRNELETLLTLNFDIIRNY